MGNKYKRTRLWVDPAFQFRLLFRMGFYLFLYTLILLHVGFASDLMADLGNNGPRQSFQAYYLEFLGRQRFFLFAVLLSLPVILYDLVRFSNRIAGPLYRCRRVMQEMASGKPVAEFQPRKRDLMRELFRTFNDLIRAWNVRVSAGVNGHRREAKAAETAADEVELPAGSNVGAPPQRVNAGSEEALRI
jgi:hypothetical protein